ncbi:MAG: hypothetical protein ACHQQ3_10035 [Gemmatimonadales bacterium]
MDDAAGAEERIIALDELATTAVGALLQGLMLYGAQHAAAPESHIARGPLFDENFHEAVQELAQLVLRRAKHGANAERNAQVAGSANVVLELTASAERASGRDASLTDPEHFTAGDALRSVSHLLEYTALEELDAAVRLESKGTEGWLLHWKSLTSEAAHVGLLESMYLALDRKSLEHPFIAAERAASLWWFSRNGPLVPETREGARAWKMREHEWSLADRKSIATGKTVLEMACEAGFEATLGPRSRRMVRSAKSSMVGIFVVGEKSGGEFRIEDLLRQELLTLREHDLTLAYGPGTLIVGRLYPFGPKRYLRSPAAFVLDTSAVPSRAELVSRAEALVRDGCPLGVALEAAVVEVVTQPGAQLPHGVPAAGSGAEARQQLDALQSSMHEVGAFALPDAVGVRWLEPTEPPTRWKVFGWNADVVMADWVDQLRAVAGIAT